MRKSINSRPTINAVINRLLRIGCKPHTFFTIQRIYCAFDGSFDSACCAGFYARIYVWLSVSVFHNSLFHF